jgi:hypothetical protein
VTADNNDGGNNSNEPWKTEALTVNRSYAMKVPQSLMKEEFNPS